MGILKLSSNNPNFSFIISKNPATIDESKKPYTREIRKGVAYGWFADKNQTFALWFRDANNENSFRKGVDANYEYLDKTRYSSPYLPITLIANCLSSAAKKLDVNDTEGFEASVVTAIKITNQRHLDFLVKHYASMAPIEVQQISGSHVEITVRAPLVHTVLNVLQIVCLLQSLSDSDCFVDMSTGAIQKYLYCLNATNAPYFVRYLFGTSSHFDRKTFDLWKKEIQGPAMSMNYGNTRLQRLDAISGFLEGRDILIDIGCGELFQSLKLAERYKTVYAIDADIDVNVANDQRIEKLGISNVIPMCARITPEWVKLNAETFKDADILLTEVIEHMPLEDAMDLIKAILETEYKCLIVTTPNKDFNQYYEMDDGDLRHPDHQWEMTFAGYGDWIKLIADNVKDEGHGSCLTIGIGDVVDGHAITSCTIFSSGKQKQPNIRTELVRQEDGTITTLINS